MIRVAQCNVLVCACVRKCACPFSAGWEVRGRGAIIVSVGDGSMHQRPPPPPPPFTRPHRLQTCLCCRARCRYLFVFVCRVALPFTSQRRDFHLSLFLSLQPGSAIDYLLRGSQHVKTGGCFAGAEWHADLSPEISTRVASKCGIS